jgi:tetratricopeptide (TPR) repeat protein
MGDIKHAIRCVKEEIDEYGLSSRRCRELGKLCIAAGDYVGAVQAFQNALAQEKGDKTTRIWLGAALMENGNYELAEYEFSELLRENPHDFQAHMHLAELRVRENRLHEAEHFLSEVEKQFPQNSRVLLCRAEIAFLQEKYKRAVRLGEEALANTPFYFTWEQMRCHRVLKHAYRKLGESSDARLHAELEEVLKTSRDVFSGLIRVAELKLKSKEYDGGKKILRRILDLYPCNAHAQVVFAEALYYDKQYAEAIHVAEKLVASTPPRYVMEHSRAHVVLRKAYLRIGKAEKAPRCKRRRGTLRA